MDGYVLQKAVGSVVVLCASQMDLWAWLLSTTNKSNPGREHLHWAKSHFFFSHPPGGLRTFDVDGI